MQPPKLEGNPTPNLSLTVARFPGFIKPSQGTRFFDFVAVAASFERDEQLSRRALLCKEALHGVSAYNVAIAFIARRAFPPQAL